MPRPDRSRRDGRFRSLRLSVRTPPFHGGDGCSIPLGSAINFNGLAPASSAMSYRCLISGYRREWTTSERGTKKNPPARTAPSLLDPLGKLLAIPSPNCPEPRANPAKWPILEHVMKHQRHFDTSHASSREAVQISRMIS